MNDDIDYIISKNRSVAYEKNKIKHNGGNMREYTFKRSNGDEKVIEARSLKKAIIKYGGKTEGNDNNVYVFWTRKKKNDSEVFVKLPHITRKERKGKL